jgi:hypothetical protein
VVKLNSLKEVMAFGFDGDGQIQKLKFNIKQGNAITNLSQILVNPNFLKCSWVKKMFQQREHHSSLGWEHG